MNVVVQIIAFLFVIALLVFIHEAGHFFVARWRRVWVHQFAVGFGPAIWKRQRGETEYSIRLFPLGGFVRMAGEDRLSEEDKSVPSDRLFTSKKPLERMAIVAAGPLANILGAIALQIAIVGGFGVYYQEVAAFSETSVAKDKLEIGDKIIEIDNQLIYSREQIQRLIRSSQGTPLGVKILRGDIHTDGQLLEFTIAPKFDAESGVYRIGTYFAFAGSTNKIQSLDPNSYLGKSGLQSNDRILEAGGHKVYSASQFLSQLDQASATPTKSLHLQVSRNGQIIPVTLDVSKLDPSDPDAYKQEISNLLQSFKPEFVSRPVGFAQTISIGFAQIGDALIQMYETIRQIFAGRASAGDSFSGPVGIANIIGQSINLGWMPFLGIVALLSLNLGLINLFPFPALDGSRIIFILIELIIRRPIPPEKEGMVHYVGFILLLALILLVTFNDIRRLFS
jgi:regulator of sigma E protease